MTTSYPLVIMMQRVGKLSSNPHDPKIMQKAAKHNLREIAAELMQGAANSIDPDKTHLNYVLRGASTSGEIISEMNRLMEAAKAKVRRKDAIRGVELILSLPKRSDIDHHSCFEDFLTWVGIFFAGIPIISAVAHLDETAPHLHVILLPIIDGYFRGNEIMGNAVKLKSMHQSCYEMVGKRHGLTLRKKTKVKQKENQQAAEQLIDMLSVTPQLLRHRTLRTLLATGIADDIEVVKDILATFKIAPNKRHSADSFVGIMTRPMSKA